MGHPRRVGAESMAKLAELDYLTGPAGPAAVIARRVDDLAADLLADGVPVARVRAAGRMTKGRAAKLRRR